MAGPPAARADMAVEVLTIGDELLLGFTTDTNGPHLSRALAEAGIRVVRRCSVGDEATAVAAAIREGLARTGAVITSGGLGPTSDDRTREAVAEVFGRRLEEDAAIVAGLRDLWRARGWGDSLPASNLRQALVPEGAIVLPNRHGTAPGLWLEDADGRWVAMLPGVPREFRGMLADTLLPRLVARAEASGLAGSVVRSRTVRTTGIGESKLADVLGDLARGVHGLPLAFLPGFEGVDLRLTIAGHAAQDAERRLAAAADALIAKVRPHVYGFDDTDLAEVVLGRCRERDARLAVAESCTGGLLGARLTAVPGASDTFLGGVIAYDNFVKTTQLGMRAMDITEHGAVSECVASRMASGVRARFGADVGVAITGIAGPSGGSDAKPVGTVWVATDIGGAVRTAVRVLPGNRAEIRQRAAQMALDLVRRALDAST